MKKIVVAFLIINNVYAFERTQVARYADRWVKDWTYYPNDTLRNNGGPLDKPHSIRFKDEWPYHSYTRPIIVGTDTLRKRDCANYVSQCLIAGGLTFWKPPHLDEEGNIIYPPWTDDRGAIINCDSLDKYLQSLYGATRTSIVYPNGSPPAGFETGDFEIFGYETGAWFKHAAIVSGGNGSNTYCNAHDNDRYHRSWNWAWGTGSGQFMRVSFYEIPDDAGWLPDLSTATPYGWDGAIVLSSTPGTHTSDPENLQPGDIGYFDFAVVNFGYIISGETLVADIPDTVYYYFYINGEHICNLIARGMWGGYLYWKEDVQIPIPYSPTGEIRCSLVADPMDYWKEYDESNNIYVRAFKVVGIPEEYINVEILSPPEGTTLTAGHPQTISFKAWCDTPECYEHNLTSAIIECRYLGFYSPFVDTLALLCINLTRGVYA